MVMAIQRTFAMIKPDAYKAGNMGNIIAMIEKAGFKIVHARLLKFTEKSASQFYEIHIGQPFYEKLIQFSVTDKVMALVLEREKAIDEFRKLIGNTDPKKAESQTVRAKYGTGLPPNAIHGSDSEATAKKEITYIFGEFAAIPSVEKTNGKEY
jgi:nucleoside-diphosphate kinase